MTAPEIIQSLTDRGVILSADADQLLIEDPDDALTDDLLDALRQHKSELLEFLAAEPSEVCPICHCELQERRGKQFRHLWCPTPGHFDAWRAMPGHKLGETPLFNEWRGKEKAR